MVCSHETLAKLAVVSSACSQYMKNIVVMSSQVQKHFDASKVAKGIQVMSFERVSELGAARILAGDLTINPPNTNDCAIIMYTSGSTGKPKGNNCSSQCKAGSDIRIHEYLKLIYEIFFFLRSDA